MNANKQDAGGLPELPAWMDDYKIPCDAFDGGEDVRLSDRMRAYGELCRAAPAGGGEKLARFGHHPDPAIDFEIEVESLQSRLFNAKHGLAKVGTQPETVEVVSTAITRAMEFRVGGDESAVRAKAMLRAMQSDSAPAGSGEVDDAEALREFTEYFVKNYPGPHTVIMDPNWHAPKIFRAAKRALLRKLQQGAE